MCEIPLHTSQPVDSPLFKLFEGDVCGRRIRVKVETMGVIEVLVCGCSKLLLAVIEDIAPLRINSVEVLPQHDVVVGIVIVSVQCEDEIRQGGMVSGRRKVGDA